MAGLDFDLSFQQIAELRELMMQNDAQNVTGSHVGTNGVIDCDLFNDQDERLLHAVITPSGVVRTNPVIGLGAAPLFSDQDDPGTADTARGLDPAA
jgi:hypothetical protein